MSLFIFSDPSQNGVRVIAAQNAVMGLTVLGLYSANLPVSEVSRSGGYATYNLRLRMSGDDDPVTVRSGYFRRNWDTEYDLNIPMPFTRAAVPPTRDVFQAMNRGATR